MPDFNPQDYAQPGTFNDPNQQEVTNPWAEAQAYAEQAAQQAAYAEAGRQVIEAFQTDPEAAHVEIAAQMYGPQYGAELAQTIGRPDLIAQYIDLSSQPAANDPRLEAMWAEHEARQFEAQQEVEYEQEKAAFLAQHPDLAEFASRNVEGYEGDLIDHLIGVQEVDDWSQVADHLRAWQAEAGQQQAPTTVGSSGGDFDAAIEDVARTLMR